ncbi:MAG: acyltransferase 3 [Gammaproteobacteria bacterium]|nr:acyltransferase 3 [Gammaproteobacteria bacterium]
MTKPSRHIPSLDGLRAISFLLVFVAHCGLDQYVPGGLGVTVFFFLSGFLITTLMRAEFQANGAVNFRHFWLRRALRILPPFYIVLFGAIAGALLFDPPGTLSGPAVAAQLLHVTNYWMIYRGSDGQPAGTGVYWSLAVEEHFYLLFPWLYVGMQKLRLPPFNQALCLWVLCGLVLLWRYVLVYHFHVTMDRTYMATDTRLDSILFGCALAVWKNPVLDELNLNERRWKYVIVPSALLVLAVCLMFRSAEFRETARYTLQGAALTFVFIAAIKFPSWLPFRLLNLRALSFIGLLSYSLYLMHFAVIIAVQRLATGVGGGVQAVLSFLVSMGLAWAMYVSVEKPFARLRRQLSD